MIYNYLPDGSRDRSYQNYIFAEETCYGSSLYDPFRSKDYGLYSYGNGVPPALTTSEDVYLYNQKLLRSGTMYSDASKSSLMQHGFPSSPLEQQQMLNAQIPYEYQSDYNKQEGPYKIYGMAITASGSGALGRAGRTGMYKRLFATYS